ncbi:malonic semialdehyde reductase [Burkholderia cenocepacia]|uniref:Malonic semialdehyde reductase n=1 Tax=Burkholderia cenocepacia TaxID=95486 RepID=A0A6J5JVU0_9BURK|nr:malonic semialdehyde reductase [Burkholderia cenocepacia]
MAARALGGDAGPMSGFDGAKVDAAFFAGTAIKRNFLVNLGYGDPAGLFPRSPRFDFDDIAASSDGRWPAPAPVDVGLAPALSKRGNVPYPPRVSRISVISDGTPKRFGGPQYPVPRLV